MKTHTVALNEALSTIAATHRVPVAAVLAANPTKPRVLLGSGVEVFASLSAGEDLAIPSSPAELGDPDPGEPLATSASTSLSGTVPSRSYSVPAVAAITVLAGVVGAAAGALFMHFSMRPDGSHAWEGAHR